MDVFQVFTTATCISKFKTHGDAIIFKAVMVFWYFHYWNQTTDTNISSYFEFIFWYNESTALFTVDRFFGIVLALQEMIL